VEYQGDRGAHYELERRGHCPGCQVGLTDSEECWVQACPCYGTKGDEALIRAATVHPQVLSVARGVADGSLKPGDRLPRATMRHGAAAAPLRQLAAMLDDPLTAYERDEAAADRARDRAEAEAERRAAYDQARDDAWLRDLGDRVTEFRPERQS
jgi:hypothetical protein